MDKKLRCGFTTGSCAAAASKAAAFMLLTGKEKTEITIQTPKGIPYHAKICDILRAENEVSCAVEKDGGDDPDVTTGSLVYAKVMAQDSVEALEGTGQTEGDRKNRLCSDKAEIFIDGGAGVGRVTRPGLDQPVGNAAINHVPREMITKELMEVCEMTDFCGMLKVEISVPGGEELAQKTFNPRLGIVGGISILGTTGIVEPMSEKALLDTILVELRQHRALGEDTIAVSPGNYGLDYMKLTFGYDLDKSVKCSNFIGNTIDMAVECGFTKMLLTGHIGKLIKVSGGMMNTHSKEGDCRMELLAAAALRAGVDTDAVCRILDCVVTEEALAILTETDRLKAVMDKVMEKIMLYLDRRGNGRIQIECMMYSNEYGELACSEGAKALLKEIMEENGENK